MMKRKYLAILLSLALTTSGLAGCSGDTDTEEGNESGKVSEASVYEGGVYGEVSAVGEDTLTIKLGTFETADENESKEDTDAAGGYSGSPVEASAQNEERFAAGLESGEVPGGESGAVGLTLTGQEVAIQLKDDAVIKSWSFGLFEDDEAADEGESAETADGESGDGKVPDSGEAADNGNGGGDAADNGNGGGDAADNGNGGGDAPDNGNDGSAAPDSGNSGREMPDMADREMTERTITLEDISEGDIVSITLDEEGYAETITVLISN